MIQILGRGTLLDKTDLECALHLLPIYQGDFDLLLSAVTNTTSTIVCIWL